jgi:hypothetical protein
VVFALLSTGHLGVRATGHISAHEVPRPTSHIANLSDLRREERRAPGPGLLLIEWHMAVAVAVAVLNSPCGKREVSEVTSASMPDSSCELQRGLDRLKILQDFLSHRIFRYIHEALNVGKKNKYLHSLSVNVETNLLSLVSP